MSDKLSGKLFQAVNNCTCPGKETLFSGNMLYRCAIDMDGVWADVM